LPNKGALWPCPVPFEVRCHFARPSLALPLCLRLLSGCHSPAASCHCHFLSYSKAFRGNVPLSRKKAPL
jgi:hypothetical protein